VVVEAGETVIVAVIAPPGLQRKLGLAALWVAVKRADPPAHTVAEFTETIGSAFTLSVAELVTELQAPDTSTE
jgi:hypothetical protein